jgi:hypothetical protein
MLSTLEAVGACGVLKQFLLCSYSPPTNSEWRRYERHVCSARRHSNDSLSLRSMAAMTEDGQMGSLQLYVSLIRHVLVGYGV